MGEAKRRGTFEERKATAIARQEVEEASKPKVTPEEQKAIEESIPMIALAGGLYFPRR